MHVDLEKQPWRFRFSLRSLFVLTTIVCLVLWFIPRYLEWREYQQTRLSIARIIESMEIPTGKLGPADFDSGVIGYDGQMFFLSTSGDTFHPGQGVFAAEALQERPRFDSIYVSPPDIWVQRDSDAIMALIIKTHDNSK